MVFHMVHLFELYEKMENVKACFMQELKLDFIFLTMMVPIGKNFN